MPSPLVEAHIEAEKRLRVGTVAAIEAVWKSLPGYDRPDADAFVSRVVPIVLAAQRQSVAVTEAFLGAYLKRPPIGVNPENLIGAAVRNGTPPAEVYQRPFVTVWTALGSGTAYEDAVSAGLARAKEAAAMDPQLSMRATANAVQAADEGIYGYQRAADGGACAFCQEVDGAYVKSADAMALHNNCGCGLEPLTAPHPRASKLPSGVAVHEHGELGPMLIDPAHSFTGPSGLN